MSGPGAYGLCWSGLPERDAGAVDRFVAAPERFITAPPHWRPWTVATSFDGTPRGQVWSSTQAVLRMRPNGYSVVDRKSSTTQLVLVEQPESEAFAHPLLSLTAATVAAWSGHNSFHAGCFVHDGRAWLICADSDSGKSSMLCWLAGHGYRIVADDLAVVADGMVMAGPRCVDLRESAAEHFGVGDDVGVLGSRRRWRMPLGAVEAETPFGGWIAPQWSLEAEVAPLAPVARMNLIVGARALLVQQADTPAVMALLAAPAFSFRRPRSWAALDASMQLLLSCLPGH